MWMFYVDRSGYIPMGSDGQLKVPSNTRTMNRMRELAQSWLGKRRGAIYLMRSWTNEMTNYGPTAFNQYIQHHGTIMAVR